MRGLTKLGLALLLVFSFSLLALIAELLFLLRRRHLRRFDPEVPAGRFLCGKNRSRVEPASAAISPSPKPPPPSPQAATDDDADLASWRAMYFVPSRALYTIEEEAESTGEDDVEEETETPFYTPSSSPPRAVEEVDRKVEISVVS